MSLFNMLYGIIAWLETCTRYVFEGQEVQEGPSNKENDVDDLDDGKLYSLVILRWEGEPLAGLPDGATLSDLMLFLDEVYEKDYVFGYDEKLNLVFVGMETVQEIRVIKALKKQPRSPLDEATVVQFIRKK